MNEKELKKIIAQSLGKEKLQESYVTQAKK